MQVTGFGLQSISFDFRVAQFRILALKGRHIPAQGNALCKDQRE